MQDTRKVTSPVVKICLTIIGIARLIKMLKEDCQPASYWKT